MAVSPDLEFQKLSTVHGNWMPKPATLASAATIAPQTFLTFVSGTVQIATITPPIDGAHMIALVFTNATPGALLTTGNIALAATPIQNRVMLLVFDPSTAKYYSHSTT
jgi:hypothetical protein